MLGLLQRSVVRTVAVGAVLGAGALVASNLVQPRGNYQFVALTDDENREIVATNVTVCELLDRLRRYRMFRPKVFDETVRTLWQCARAERALLEGTYDARAVRVAPRAFTDLSLRVVDGIRVLRHQVETHPDAGHHLPEFDSVAADIQSYINDATHNVSFASSTMLDRGDRR